MTDQVQKRMTTKIIVTESHEVLMIEPPNIDAKRASEIKKHGHPGSFIELPDGQKIHMQFGKSPLEVRNGVTSSELLLSIIAHFKVYQEPGNHMASRETALMITKLEEAYLWSEKRQLDREAREVRFEDKA